MSRQIGIFLLHLLLLICVTGSRAMIVQIEYDDDDDGSGRSVERNWIRSSSFIHSFHFVLFLCAAVVWSVKMLVTENGVTIFLRLL